MTLEHIGLIFATVVGACVGSFLNVVIYRVPEGRSIVSPPSACPHCGHGLAWYDNVPILGWIWLRGRCRYCQASISPQYPIIEAVTAILFGGWFYLCYFTNLRPDFAGAGWSMTWGAMIVHMVLLAALLAATLIDWRYYIIPLSIPWTATAAAALLLPLVVWTTVMVDLPDAAPGGVPRTAGERLAEVREPYGHASAVQLALARRERGSVEISPAPLALPPWAGAGLGGAAGLLIALVGLWTKKLPQSFADAEEHLAEAEADNPHAWLAYPHARREMLKEIAFLAAPVLGAIVGWWLARDAAGPWPLWLRVLGGVLLGYLAGGAVVWGTRILGTLSFGKEAMGLGDVHLMAAVGAVCGWAVPILAFFIAPFFGLTWAGLSAGLSRLLKREVRVIPYGPHLALATVVVMVFREPLMVYFGRLTTVVGPA
ncbi:MAG: prepilin peptidase [Phycisphaerae bacterium]|nr:prepilin peptidase [Phycisphaerae bacterium]